MYASATRRLTRTERALSITFGEPSGKIHPFQSQCPSEYTVFALIACSRAL